jgi:hypothetical protein
MKRPQTYVWGLFVGNGYLVNIQNNNKTKAAAAYIRYAFLVSGMNFIDRKVNMKKITRPIDI